MSKKKKDRIDPESYEQGRDPHYPSWKSDAQWEKMNADFERLQREEKDNYPKIIASLQELKKKYEQLLTQLEHRFEEQRVFYHNFLKLVAQHFLSVVLMLHCSFQK